MTEQVIEPLLTEIQDSEWALVKAFLAPMNKRAVRRSQGRPTVLERQRNQLQALETYPFLESIWHSDVGTESPMATSLLSALSARDRRTIRRVIDEGRPLGSLLARELRLEPWMIEHLRRHWSAYRAFDRSHYPDRRWDFGAMLSLWTPETAPQTLEELVRLQSLMYRRHNCLTPFYRSMKSPISREDRLSLRRLIHSGPRCEQMLGYLRFIHSLNQWILSELGQDCTGDLPYLLGAKNANDWMVYARRWDIVNGEMKRRAREGDASPDQCVHFEWPALLTQVEPVSDFTFTSLHSDKDLLAESQTMHNCASTYLVLCAIGEAHMLHMAQDNVSVGTLEVCKAMQDDNTKIVLVHAEAAAHEPLTAAAEHAVQQFVKACNDGTVRLNPEAVISPSVRLQLLAPMLKLLCIDYPTWARSNAGHHYFALHAKVTGADVIDHYRAALELHIGAKDSLFQLATRAVRECLRRKPWSA